MPIPAAAWALGSTILGGMFSSRGQSSANRTNVRLQREAQQWEKMMSDTAVQRRRWDIERAGGNPALAFTNGQEASTPSVAPARVESTTRDAAEMISNTPAKIMMMQQMQQAKANTRLTNAQAEREEIQAAIDRASQKGKTEFTVNDFIEKFEQSDLRTKIMRSLDANTATTAKRNEQLLDKIVQAAANQAKIGKLNADALENIATVGGIEAEQASWLVKLIVNSMVTLMGQKD